MDLNSKSKVVPFIGHGTQATEPKFPWVKATDAMDWPPPEYWDKEKLFLKAFDGSVSMIYAEFSNLKTTTAVCRALSIAKEHDANILYVAAEGVGFLGPLTGTIYLTTENGSRVAGREFPRLYRWLMRRVSFSPIGGGAHARNQAQNRRSRP
jgi:hypothetical protein